MNHQQLNELGQRLRAVAENVAADPARLTPEGVTTLLLAVRDMGFEVGTALRSFDVMCKRNGLGDELEHIVESLRHSGVLGALNTPKGQADMVDVIDPRTWKKSLCVHSIGGQATERVFGEEVENLPRRALETVR